MNENIDLTEILKDCPKGTKLYTTVWGEVTFYGINNEKPTYPIYIKTDVGYIGYLTKEGHFTNKIDADCILFPSKEQRDWSKFTAPWYKKERDAIACLETQGEDKKEINNNFDVLPGLYKCIHRMFDGTPDGRLLFEIGNVYKCLSKHNRAEFEVSHGHSVYLEDPVVCKYFIPFESKGEQVSSQVNERAWLHIVSDVLTWKDGIGQYLDDRRVQEFAKKLCDKYVQKLYNHSNDGKDEQKSADKVEPKFKVGDWVVRGDTIAQILDVQEQYYVGLDINGKDFVSSRFLNDDQIHLWTINDAKDGDVLAISWWEDENFWEKIIIFKKYHNKGVKELYSMPCIEGYGNTFKNGKIAFTGEDVPYYSKTWTCNLLPATKEQRDLLFQKIKEAGYKRDAETKTLEKLVSDKFDPRTLQPFDKVLCRNGIDIWRCDFFSSYMETYACKNVCISGSYLCCIPYNDETKHLVGTYDEAPEYYRYWEE